jgi:hypothetical protein
MVMVSKTREKALTFNLQFLHCYVQFQSQRQSKVIILLQGNDKWLAKEVMH